MHTIQIHHGDTEGTKTLDGSELTGDIIGAVIEVHRHMGPGLLESAYEEALYFELSSRGHKVSRQIELPVVYKDHKLDVAIVLI